MFFNESCITIAGSIGKTEREIAGMASKDCGGKNIKKNIGEDQIFIVR